MRHLAGPVRLARACAAELAGLQLATPAVVFVAFGPNRKINRLTATTAAVTPNTGATTNRDIDAPIKAPAHIVKTTLNRSFSRAPVPPARWLSRPRLTMVDVNTVVESS